MIDLTTGHAPEHLDWHTNRRALMRPTLFLQMG